MNVLKKIWILALLSIAGGCCMVDEDLSDCDKELGIDYELRLVTNMKIEMDTVLDAEADRYVYDALKEYLKDIFSDFAHDVDLSFYDTQDPMAVLKHMSEIMDANQTSYTLHLPVREYMHLAVANIVGNDVISLQDIAECHSSKINQLFPESGDCTPHTTGLFTARLPMNIRADVSQHFKVDLYMANSATALVMDTADAATVKGVKVVDNGFADSFNIADSTYTYNRTVQVEAEDIPVEGGYEKCYTSVHFPSRDYRPESKVVIETLDPFVSLDAEKAIWRWEVYVTTADGKITKTTLGIHKPLRAGQLKILKVKLHDTGIVTVEDPTVAVGVELDWNPGLNHDIPL